MKSLALLLLSASTLLAACESPARSADASSAKPAPAETAPAHARGALERVADPSQVCMVNDQFMGTAQIPVKVGGKTYYGCCAMCEQRLAQDASARVARDPVTGALVDKATAVIGKDAEGEVRYFESEGSLRAYRP